MTTRDTQPGDDSLAHTKTVMELLAEGHVADAKQLHNTHVRARFEAAKRGETICLSDLMAAKEQIDDAGGQ